MPSSARIVLGIVIIFAVAAGTYAFLQSPNTAEGPAPVPTAGTSETKLPLKIGFIGPLTGDGASIGQNAKAAVEIAVAEINLAGGVKGRTLEVIYEDGQCTGKVASNAANKLITADNVPVILGGLCSGETAAFAPAAEEAKRVVLSFCSSAPSITQAGDYIFRDYPSDLYQGSYGAEYVYNNLGKRNVAVLYVKTDYGGGLKNVFSKKFTDLGGKVVFEEGYDQATRDLRTQFTKIKSAKPDIVYFVGYTDASIIGIKQASDMKIGVPLFGVDGWDDPKIWSSVGSAGEGAMYTVVYSPMNDAFKAALKAKTQSDEVGLCSPQAYDGTKIVAQVIGKVGSNPEDIKNELYKTEYAGGVSSEKISFDSNGDLVGASYIIKVVKNGKTEVLK